MFEPTVFILALLTIVVLAVIMALALLVTLRLFSLETLEFQPLFFITLMGNLLAGGLGYVVLVILARSAGLRQVMLGETAVPTMVLAVAWLVVLLILFFGLMVRIAGRISFVRAMGAVTLAALLVGALLFIAGILMLVVMGVSPESALLQLFRWFGEIPAHMAGG